MTYLARIRDLIVEHASAERTMQDIIDGKIPEEYREESVRDELTQLIASAEAILLLDLPEELRTRISRYAHLLQNLLEHAKDPRYVLDELQKIRLLKRRRS